MNITFRPTNYSSDADCEAIARWQNNPYLQALWLPAEAANQSPATITAAQVRANHANAQPSFAPALDELAILGGRIVGQITLVLNPPNRKSSADLIAWPSVVIGEDSLRGRGVIRRFGERIFTASKELGATHLEVGVFEFNSPMRRLLEKADFIEFAQLEGTTWRNGKSWADIRYQRAI